MMSIKDDNNVIAGNDSGRSRDFEMLHADPDNFALNRLTVMGWTLFFLAVLDGLILWLRQ